MFDIACAYFVALPITLPYCHQRIVEHGETYESRHRRQHIQRLQRATNSARRKFQHLCDCFFEAVQRGAMYERANDRHDTPAAFRVRSRSTLMISSSATPCRAVRSRESCCATPSKFVNAGIVVKHTHTRIAHASVMYAMREKKVVAKATATKKRQ